MAAPILWLVGATCRAQVSSARAVSPSPPSPRPTFAVFGYVPTPTARVRHLAVLLIAPAQGRPGILGDGIVVGRLGERGEIGAFGDAEIVERLVEIIERRGRHAVIAGPQIDLVHIELEDAVLAVGSLD